MSWILKEITKTEAGPPINLQANDNVIGRKVGNFIRLTSSYASRHHCTIKVKTEGAYIIDHNTLNGTFIGPDKVPTNREIPLQTGDLIGIGLAATEFSPEPYYQIFQSDVDPEVVEIPDTCDATMLYVQDRLIPHMLNDGIVFRAPNPPLRNSINRYPSLSIVKREQSKLPVKSECNSNSAEVEIIEIDPSQNDDGNINHSNNTDKNNEVKIKNEVNSFNGKSNVSGHEFSICDNDIIVIDDDEDEDDLPCSQFFSSTRKESPGINEEVSLDSFRAEGGEDVQENADDSHTLEEIIVIDDDNPTKRLSSEAQSVLDYLDNEMEKLSNLDTANSLIPVHSQMSPETYLTRVDNENELNGLNKNVELDNDDLLAALLTQKETSAAGPHLLNLNDLIGNVEFLLPELRELTSCTNTAVLNRDEEESPRVETTSNSTSKTCENLDEKLASQDNSVTILNKSKLPPKTPVTETTPKSSPKAPTGKRRNESKNEDEPKNKSPRLSEVNVSSRTIKSKVNEPLKSRSTTPSNALRNIKDAGKILEECLKKFKKSPKSKKEPYNLRHSEKRKLIEKRREKLKEVAMKEKEQKSSKPATVLCQNENESTGNKCFIKNTEKNRSAILIDMIPQRSRSKKKSHDSNEAEGKSLEKHEDSDATGEIPAVRRSLRNSIKEKENVVTSNEIHKRRSGRISDSNKNNSAETSPSNNVEVVSKKRVSLQKNISGDKQTVPVKRKSSLKTGNSPGSPKNVKFADGKRLTMVKYYEKDPVELTRSSTVCGTRRLPPSKGSPMSKDELLYLFCKWNPKWIQESVNLSCLPPLLEGCFPNPSPVVSTYQNYCDYQNAMLPLQVYEVWETILREVHQQKLDPVIGVVKDVYAKGVIDANDPRKMDLISVTTYVCNVSCMPKRGDFVIVRGVDSNPQSATKPANNKAVWLSFGYILCQPVKKPLQHSDKSSIASYNHFKSKCPVTKERGQIFTVNFKVMIRQKITKFWRADQEISVFTCANLTSDMKLFLSLEKLYYSPLASLVLDPSCFQPIERGEEHAFKQQQSLNKEQMAAVNYCSEMVLGGNPSIALIHGPPGTGKSVVITHILMTILDQVKKDKQKVRLLLCAPSNFAVDQLISRLLHIRKKLTKNKFNLVRVGKFEMMSEDARNVSLKTLAEKTLKTFSHPETAKREIEHLGKREKYLLSLKDSNPENQQSIAEEINNTRRYVRELQLLSQNKADQNIKNNLLKRYEKDLLLKADIVATTLSSSVSLPVQEAFSKRDSSPFGCCIIDEATQATELQTLTPILLDVNKFILVGDHKQLSPVITSQKAKADGLEVSLFERLLSFWEGKSAPVFPLIRQYRMHREIAEFPNRCFYSGNLISDWNHHSTRLRPYLIFSHNFRQSPNQDINIDEGNLVIKLVEIIRSINEFKRLSVGIITPYQAQRELLRKKMNPSLLNEVSIMTVDSAQGQERDIIVLSCVKTHSIGFLGDANRLNVALTRAKHALFIAANFNSLKENKIWNNLLTDAKKRKSVHKLSSIPSESVMKRYVCLT